MSAPMGGRGDTNGSAAAKVVLRKRGRDRTDRDLKRNRGTSIPATFYEFSSAPFRGRQVTSVEELAT